MLFSKPTLDHKNERVRCKALKTIDDDKTLLNVVKNDASSLVRLAALSKIKNEINIVKGFFTLNEKRDKIEVLNTIENPSIFIAVAIKEKDEQICELAIKQIDKLEELEQVILKRKDDEIQQKAIEKFFHVISNSKNRIQLLEKFEPMYNKIKYDERVNYSRGILYCQSGSEIEDESQKLNQIKKGIQLLEKALEIKPGKFGLKKEQSNNARYTLGLFYFQQKMYSKAREHVDSLAAYKPSQESLKLYVNVYMKLGILNKDKIKKLADDLNSERKKILETEHDPVAELRAQVRFTAGNPLTGMDRLYNPSRSKHENAREMALERLSSKHKFSIDVIDYVIRNYKMEKI